MWQPILRGRDLARFSIGTTYQEMGPFVRQTRLPMYTGGRVLAQGTRVAGSVEEQHSGRTSNAWAYYNHCGMSHGGGCGGVPSVGQLKRPQRRNMDEFYAVDIGTATRAETVRRWSMAEYVLHKHLVVMYALTH